MGHVLRHAKIFRSQLAFSLPGSSGSAFRATSRLTEFCGGASHNAPGSDRLQSLLGSLRGFSTSGHSQLELRHEGLLPGKTVSNCNDMNLGARSGLPSLLDCEYDSSASFPRIYSSNSYAPSSLFSTAAGIQLTTKEHGLGFRQPMARFTMQRSPVRGDRGFAKAVALPPQMQKPMKLRVFMGSPGVIGEPWKPLPPPLPFLNGLPSDVIIFNTRLTEFFRADSTSDYWFTKEGWKIRRRNVQGMLKTGFTLAKIRQKTKGYSQTKFYRDASELYKEINSALAGGDRSALRQLVTENVLVAMKKELKHREQAWQRVQWELVGPLKTIRTLQGRLIGIDQKNMDTAFAQITLRIISNQKFAAYDKQGKLVAGDPEKELTVEDIWVFERQISQPEVRWKLCGRLSA